MRRRVMDVANKSLREIAKTLKGRRVSVQWGDLRYGGTVRHIRAKNGIVKFTVVTASMVLTVGPECIDVP